jgi:hypothetical protein
MEFFFVCAWFLTLYKYLPVESLSTACVCTGWTCSWKRGARLHLQLEQLQDELRLVQEEQ